MPRRKRVDLPDNLQYGQRKQLEEAQDAVSPVDEESVGLFDASPSPSSGLHGPTRNTSEPLSTGMSFGPGAGPEANLRPSNSIDEDTIRMAKNLPVLELMASRGDVSSRTRSAIRRARSRLPANP